MPSKKGKIAKVASGVAGAGVGKIVGGLTGAALGAAAGVALADEDMRNNLKESGETVFHDIRRRVETAAEETNKKVGKKGSR